MRLFKRVELHGPHLVLSDIGSDHCVLGAMSVNFLNDGFRSVRFRCREDHLVFIALKLTHPLRMPFFRELFQNLRKDLFHIAPEAHIRTDILSDLRAVDIDMDRHTFFCVLVQVACRAVRESDSDCQKQITFGLGLDGRIFSVHAAHSKIQRIGGRNGGDSHHRKTDRRVDPF